MTNTQNWGVIQAFVRPQASVNKHKQSRHLLPPHHKEKNSSPSLFHPYYVFCGEKRDHSKVHGGGVYQLKINPCDKCRNDFCINYRLDHILTGGQRQSLNSFLPSSILLHVFLPSFLQFFLLFLLLPRLLFSPLSSPLCSFRFLFVFSTIQNSNTSKNNKHKKRQRCKVGKSWKHSCKTPKACRVNKYSISNQAIFFPLLPTNLPPIFAPSL